MTELPDPIDQPPTAAIDAEAQSRAAQRSPDASACLESASAVTPVDAPAINRPAAKRTGRPTIRTTQMITEFLRRVEAGESVASICRDDHMPGHVTIWNWLHNDAALFEAWTRARQRSAHALIENAVAIADDDSNDVLYDGGDRPIPNAAAVKRSQLRVEYRKWLASKLDPQYRSTTDIEINGTIEIELGARLDQAQRRLAAPVIDVEAQDVVSKPSGKSDSCRHPSKSTT
jgi:hypothetical protein